MQVFEFRPGAPYHGPDSPQFDPLLPSGSPETLSLDELVPFLECDLDPAQLSPTLPRLHEKWADDSLQHGIDGLRGPHAFTVLAVAMTKAATLEEYSGQLHIRVAQEFIPVKALHIYTDGSHTSDSTTWAFVVLAHGADGMYYRCGQTGGVVQTYAGHQFCGSAMLSNYSAELNGILFALAWASQSHINIDCTLHVDNQASFMCTQGSWSTSSEQSLVTLSAAILDVARVNKRVMLTHCKGHAGNPWNELADRWCDAISAGTVRPLTMPFPLPELAGADAQLVSWATSLYTGAYNTPAYPPLNGTKWIITHSEPAALPSFLESTPPPGDRLLPERQGAPMVQLSLMQLNVLTLHSEKAFDPDDHLPTLRPLYLDRQFFAAHVNIIGMQETRGKVLKLGMLPHYLTFGTSADQNGKFGVEIWLAKVFHAKTPDGDVQFTLEQKHVVVVSSGCRHLLLTARTRDMAFDCLTWHMPTSSAPRKVIDDAWVEIQEVTDMRPDPRVPLFLMIDGNLKVGSVPTECIGSHASDAQSYGGHAFSKYLTRNGLFLPSTFSQFHVSDMNHTWMAPNNSHHRIDYVAAPLAYASSEFKTKSFVDVDMDVTVSKRDHYPSRLEFTLPLRGSQGLTDRRKAIISRISRSVRQHGQFSRQMSKPCLTLIAAVMLMIITTLSIRDFSCMRNQPFPSRVTRRSLSIFLILRGSTWSTKNS